MPAGIGKEWDKAAFGPQAKMRTSGDTFFYEKAGQWKQQQGNGSTEEGSKE